MWKEKLNHQGPNRDKNKVFEVGFIPITTHKYRSIFYELLARNLNKAYKGCAFSILFFERQLGEFRYTHLIKYTLHMPSVFSMIVMKIKHLDCCLMENEGISNVAFTLLWKVCVHCNMEKNVQKSCVL